MIDLEFPILAIGTDTLVVHASAEDAQLGTVKAVRDGYFDGLLLVDANGRFSRVLGAQIAPQHSGALTRFLNAPVRLDLKFEDDGRMSVEEVTKRVIQIIENNREIWESRGNFDELRSSVLNAGEVRDVISAIV